MRQCPQRWSRRMTGRTLRRFLRAWLALCARLPGAPLASSSSALLLALSPLPCSSARFFPELAALCPFAAGGACFSGTSVQAKGHFSHGGQKGKCLPFWQIVTDPALSEC